MDDTVHGCFFGLGEVLMTELHRVQYLYCMCGFSHNSVATVVLDDDHYRYTRATAPQPLNYLPSPKSQTPCATSNGGHSTTPRATSKCGHTSYTWQ